jgi:sodium/potassium-transporting ATPase subunit alpha
MRKSNILCKSLSTVESLGAVNVICSDKTGTLTQNRMSVANIAIGSNRYTVLETIEAASTSEKSSNTVRALAAVAGLCNDASFEKADDDQPLDLRKVNGDATGISQ